MYEVTINHPKNKGGQKTYQIYRKEEADKQGIDYVYWTEAEEGGWALSDDEYVAPVIKRKLYPNDRGGHSIYLKTPWGYIMWNPQYPTKKFLVEGRRSAYTYTGDQKIKQSAPQLEKLAMCYAQTMNRDLAIDMAFGSLPGNKHSMWRRRMKSEVFKDMVRKELATLLSSHGLTEDYTLDLLTETIDLAKGKKDVTNLMRAIENLQNMHGMNEKNKVKTTTQLEGTVTKKLLDQIHEEERRLVATQVEEVEYEPHELPQGEVENEEEADEAREV